MIGSNIGASWVFALLFGACSSASAQTEALRALRKGNWDDSRSIHRLLRSDTLILSKSEKRVRKFKPNGNVKGYDRMIHCSRVPKWQRNEHPWSKFGEWSLERRSDGEFLHLDFYTGKRVLRHLETTASGIVLVVVEAPEKKLLE